MWEYHRIAKGETLGKGWEPDGAGIFRRQVPDKEDIEAKVASLTARLIQVDSELKRAEEIIRADTLKEVGYALRGKLMPNCYWSDVKASWDALIQGRMP